MSYALSRMLKFTDRFNRFFAPDCVQRELYPAPQVKFSIRKYLPKDREAVLALHDINGPGRFPEGHRPIFEDFLTTCGNKLFVAENVDAGVIACGGVTSEGPQVNTLCYGMVSPAFQGKRIGSTMALARLQFATRTTGVNFSVIYALDKSMPFYERFGYQRCDKWIGEDGREYPTGVLQYNSETMREVGRILSRRGHVIDRINLLQRNPGSEVIVKEDVNGQFSFETKPIVPVC